MPVEGDGGRSRGTAKSAAAYRTISEVSEELDVPQHVLRFWETKFSQVRPLKRGGGRRYYRPEDLVLLRQIQTLLYKEGYTIKGVQRLLREGRGDAAPAAGAAAESEAADLLADEGPEGAADPAPSESGPGPEAAPPAGLSPVLREEIQAVIADLRRLRAALIIEGD